MDLEKFFDTVCQSKLIEVLSRTIKDGRVISLIHKYLNAGVISRGMFEKTEVGMPQGGPLSPLLSNVMLNEMDKELTRRGHRFVRYADDCMIFCKSKKSAERTLNNIVPYIEEKLFLKANRTKTCVAHISKVKYLGYSFYKYKGKCRFRVHPKSVSKIDAFGAGMREANQKIANTFRTFADKPTVDYSQREQKSSKTEIVKKPWLAQKKLLEAVEVRLDGAIDKVEDLSRAVEINKMLDTYDKAMEKTHSEQEQTAPLAMVAEPDRQYGADVFDAYMKEQKAESGRTEAPVKPEKEKSKAR
jgi:hypothetical protein